MSSIASPGSALGGPQNVTPRRLNTANAATQNPQAGTRFISSCNRCRRRKIKCDAGIPSCQACSESKTTCEYHDVVANTNLPRARIIGLEQHLQHLLNLQAQFSRQSPIKAGNITVDGVVQPAFRGRLVVSGIRLACAFCRKRKIKCDGTAPCAGCTKFGKPNECSILYEEASSQGRSYMSYLEDRIAKLDRQLALPQEQSQLANLYGQTQQVPQANRSDSINSRIDPSIIQASLPPEENARSLQGELSDKVKGVLRELEGLSEDSPAVITNQSTHTPWTFRVSLLSLAGYRDETGPFMSTLSRTIVHPLIQHYVTEIHPTLPFLSLTGLDRAVERFHSEEASANEKFKVLMVIAIATSTLSEHPTSMASWNALKFFSTASYAANYNPDTLEGLELALLVLQFATLNPSKLNSWYLCGICMRACTSLGLHGTSESHHTQLTGNDDTVDSALSNKPDLVAWKSRLFWTSYSFDRVLSMTSGRPHAFEDQAITVREPESSSTEVHGEWPELLLQRLRLIRMQSVLYTRLFQCDPQATSSREESLAAVRQMELDLRDWSMRTKSLNPKAYSMFGIEFAATELLMYRPCAALPKRNTQDLLRLAEAAVRSVQAAFGTVISQPKKFYAYFMISRVYTSALSLIYAFSQTEIVHDSSNEVFRSQLAPTLSKACACLFHLTQEYLVGQNLALRFVQIHARFFEWLNAGATEELGLLEIRDFHMHHLGLLDRNHGEEGNAWTKLMHRLLTEPSVPAATMEATASGSHVGGVTGAVVLESVNGEKQGTVDSNQYAAPYQTSMIPDTNSYHEQIQHSDGLAQPAPYSQMSQFGVPGQQSQAYKFADQSLSHNNNAHFNQAGQPDGQTYTQHLPHQPRLQAGHETSNLTPLQQLAATAASHPTRTSHDHPRTASGGYTG